jgi:hypothetical protein
VPTPDIDSLGNHCVLARESCTGDATWEPLEQFKEDFLRFLGSRTSCFARREGGEVFWTPSGNGTLEGRRPQQLLSPLGANKSALAKLLVVS